MKNDEESQNIASILSNFRGLKKHEFHQNRTQESPHNRHARQNWHQQVRQTRHCGCAHGVLRGALHFNVEDTRTRTRGQRSTAPLNDAVHYAGTQQRHQPTQKSKAADTRGVNAEMIKHSTRTQVLRVFNKCKQYTHRAHVFLIYSRFTVILSLTSRTDPHQPELFQLFDEEPSKAREHLCLRSLTGRHGYSGTPWSRLSRPSCLCRCSISMLLCRRRWTSWWVSCRFSTCPPVSSRLSKCPRSGRDPAARRGSTCCRATPNVNSCIHTEFFKSSSRVSWCRTSRASRISHWTGFNCVLWRRSLR